MKRPGGWIARPVLATSLTAIAVCTALSACGGTTTQTTADTNRAVSPCETAASSEYPGCRAKQKDHETRKAFAEAEEESRSASAAETTGTATAGSPSYVGTITGSGGHTTISDRYSLGPLRYGQEETPPEVVLNACNINEPDIVDSSVFAQGEVTISYQEGSLPVQVLLNSWEELAQGGEQFLITTFHLTSGWYCNSETNLGAYTEFQPGESLTVPIWVIGPQVLTNARPRLPASVLNRWYFKFIGGVSGYSHLAVTGPGAANCEETAEIRRLMLYGRSGGCGP